MNKNTILYRGRLKSCNYRCSYCPFSKRPMSQDELNRDKVQWRRFTESLAERAESLQIRALLVAPHGEALIHPWYWEGLATLSALDFIEAVGAQTNLSFPIGTPFAHFRRAGNDIRKLRLWATFHPEMISPSSFAEKCVRLHRAGISLCAGAVGAPENIGQIRRLRALLPQEIYLWINKIDPQSVPYTEEEISTFLEIDPYFIRELSYPASEPEQCQGRLFVESDGSLRACNISPPLSGSWHEMPFPERLPRCSRKKCSCYLAYGGRADYMNRILFGDFPLFRIPRRPRAVFLDIEGTLIPGGASSVPNRTALELTAMRRAGILLFFASALPYGEALKRCRPIRHLFSGGIFAGGAHLLWKNTNEKEKREEFRTFSADILPALHSLKKKWKFRILIYKNNGKIYKITLLRPARQPWHPEEADAVWAAVPARLRASVRPYTEGPCLQIVSADTDKTSGIRTFCQWLGISLSDVAPAGDAPMLDALLERV